MRVSEFPFLFLFILFSLWAGQVFFFFVYVCGCRCESESIKECAIERARMPRETFAVMLIVRH